MASNAALRLPPRAAAPASTAPPPDGWSALAVLGGVLALIGWTDVLLGTLPWQPGSPDWEFGVVSSSLDAMPLGTLGLGMAAAGLTARGARRRLAALGVLAWALTAAVGVASLLYALSAPPVWRAAPPTVHTQLALAMARAGVLALTYLCFYTWLGVHCRRATRRTVPR